MKLQSGQDKSGRMDASAIIGELNIIYRVQNKHNTYSYIASTTFNFVINILIFCFHKIVIRWLMNVLGQEHIFKENAETFRCKR